MLQLFIIGMAILTGIHVTQFTDAIHVDCCCCCCWLSIWFIMFAVVVVVVLIAKSCCYMTPSPKLPAPHLRVAVQSTSPAPRVAPHRAPSKDVTLRSPWRASRWRCFDEGELHTKSLVYLRGTGWASGWNMVGRWEEILWQSHLEDHPRTGKWLIPMVHG